jgi:hypothetical protein
MVANGLFVPRDQLILDDRVVCPDERHGSGAATAATRHGYVPLNTGTAPPETKEF